MPGLSVDVCRHSASKGCRALIRVNREGRWCEKSLWDDSVQPTGDWRQVAGNGEGVAADRDEREMVNLLWKLSMFKFRCEANAKAAG